MLAVIARKCLSGAPGRGSFPWHVTCSRIVSPGVPGKESDTMSVKKLPSIFYAFVVMNFASVAGLYHFMRGDQVWR